MILCTIFASFLVVIHSASGASLNPNFFQRIASFPICLQLDPICNVDTTTFAQFVTASDDGMTLIYSDGGMNSVGFVDIADPVNPIPTGYFQLDSVPTNVVAVGPYVLVPVNDSKDFVNTAGRLIVIDIESRTLLATIQLGGQPASIAVSPDGKYAAIAIENERNQQIQDGFPPQLPAGFMVSIDLDGSPSSWTPTIIKFENLNGIRFPEDPEPQAVSINRDNIAAVTLQENNAIVLVDLVSQRILRVVPAGYVTLHGVDLTEDRVIMQNEISRNVLREPGGVVWIDTRYFATVDEGNLDGGSRGFTIFDSKDGSIVWTSGSSLEHLTSEIGHYPELRSGERGSEPKSVALGRFKDTNLLFVNSGRASLIFVYDITNPTSPSYLQTLPSGAGSDGLVTVPRRNLLIAGSVLDIRSSGVRSSLSIYKRGFPTMTYPTLLSDVARPDGSPIPFGALSGLAAEIRLPANARTVVSASQSRDVYATTNSTTNSLGRTRRKGGKGGGATPPPMVTKILYAIEDSFYRETRILTIDVTFTPAILQKEVRIVDSHGLLRAYDPKLVNAPNPFAADGAGGVDAATVNLDAEGIAISQNGGFWVCSDGSGKGSTTPEEAFSVTSRNYLLKVSNDGTIDQVVTLPTKLESAMMQQQQQQQQHGGGMVGVAEGSDSFRDWVVVAFERPILSSEVNPRIGAYHTTTGKWTFWYYPLDAVESPNGGWVGLADIAPLGVEGQFLVLERDNQGGPDGVIKRIYLIDLVGYPAGSTLRKTLVKDIVPNMLSRGGMILEKTEGLAVTMTGDVWIVNDNDGAELHGETQLLNVAELDPVPNKR